MNALEHKRTRVPGLVNSSFGNFLPNSLLNLSLWADFSKPQNLYVDAGTTGVSSDDDLIYQVGDLSGNSVSIVQSTESLRPAYKTGIKNNLSVARFSSSCFSLGLSLVGGEKTFIFAVDLKSTAGNQYFFDASSGRLILLSAYNTRYAVYDSGYKSFGYTSTGWQVLSYVLNPTSNTSNVFKNKIVTGASSWANRAVGGTVSLGSRYSFNSDFIDADVGEILIYNSLLSETDRNKVEDYLNRKWGIF